MTTMIGTMRASPRALLLLAGSAILVLALSNVAFAAVDGPCEGVVMVDTTTGQVQGPWCTQNSCQVVCSIKQIDCDGEQGQACECPSASPTVVCEIARTQTGKKCCPKNCPTGKDCEESLTSYKPSGSWYDPELDEEDPGYEPPSDNTNTDWAQCECNSSS